MPQNRKHTIMLRRKEVAKWYLRGMFLQEIVDKIVEIYGEEMRVTRSQVSHDLKRLHEQWEREAMRDTNKLRQQEIRKLHKLEEEYWRAWEKSIQDSEERIMKLRGSRDANKAEVQEQIKKEVTNYGNPSYLKGIQDIIKSRRELLGLDAPEARINLNAPMTKEQAMKVRQQLHEEI